MLIVLELGVDRHSRNLIKEHSMHHATRVGLAALLVGGAACQPHPRETGMADTVSAAPVAAAALSSEDQAAIRRVDEDWAKAATAGDGEAIAALYTSDATLLPPGEPIVKGEAAKKYFVDFGNGFAGPVELNTTSVEGSGDLAVVVGTYRMTLTPKKAGAKPLPTDEGKYIEIMKRQEDGSWKIQHDIWNQNPTKK
jgi:uncharacterized protein (TIGR02246 family)